MADYIIRELQNDNYRYMILSTCYINPFDDREDIEQELSSFHYKGKVLFDLLLKNGLSYNRFVEVTYNGQSFIVDSMRLVEDIDYNIKEFSANFYMQNDYLLQNSVLPDAYRFLIKKGKVL